MKLKTVRTAIQGDYSRIAKVDHPDTGRREVGQVGSEGILSLESRDSDPYGT